jgi:hypothetical protein
MATIRKRGDLQWQAIVKRKGFPLSSKTFTTRKEAETWARQIEAEIDRGLYLPRREAESTIFESLAARFEIEYAPHHYRGASWKTKLAHLRANLGKYSLAAISPQLVAKFRDQRLAMPDSRYKKNIDPKNRS